MWLIARGRTTPRASGLAQRQARPSPSKAAQTDSERNRELRLIDEAAYRFVWVAGLPWWNPTEARRTIQHPFTASVDEDVALLDVPPAEVRVQCRGAG